MIGGIGQRHGLPLLPLSLRCQRAPSSHYRTPPKHLLFIGRQHAAIRKRRNKRCILAVVELCNCAQYFPGIQRTSGGIEFGQKPVARHRIGGIAERMHDFPLMLACRCLDYDAGTRGGGEFGIYRVVNEQLRPASKGNRLGVMKTVFSQWQQRFAPLYGGYASTNGTLY